MRYMLAGVGIALWLVGAGCVSQTTGGSVAEGFWAKPPAMPLYRGLTSGMTPRQAWETICKRWTFGGTCAPLKLLGHKRYFRLTGKSRVPPDLKLFAYEEKDGAFPCVNYLFFRSRGLAKVRWLCVPRERAQINARVRKYRRTYGKPLRVFTKSNGRVRTRMWEGKESKRRIYLLVVRNRLLIGVHEDLRLLWTATAQALRPGLEDNRAHQWRTWKGMPVAMRQELLENMGRMLVRLQRLIADKPLVRLPTTTWGPKITTTGCATAPLEAWRQAFGHNKTWRTLKFTPKRPLRLQYLWQTRGGSIYSRTFTIKARGCGYRFHLIIDQNGRKITFQRLRFAKIGGEKKAKPKKR